MTDHLWIGSSEDESSADLGEVGIRAILNVAQDLRPTRGWRKLEYAHVGLVDGPGNTPAAYHAAVLALRMLLGRYDRVLVCCHSGGRALAVVVMYLAATSGRGWPGDWQADWDAWLDRLAGDARTDLPVPNEAHRVAFGEMHWRLLAAVLED